ncbi:rRNA methyltransferase 3, mitochondrial [Bulinus truncatus]|nr:rRNA methyltransferase 3, mitochondrial [Bulinus truncatus]
MRYFTYYVIIYKMAAPLRSCGFILNKFANAYISGSGKNLKEPTWTVLNKYISSNKTYSQLRKRQKLKDPKKNTQYPYVPGDPLQEDVINTLASENDHIKKINERDKKKYEIKNSELQRAITMHKTRSGLQYESLKESDKRFGQTIMELKSSKPGVVKQAILLEGSRLIKDALLLGAKIKYLYFCETEVLDSMPKEYLQDATLYKVTFKDMKIWSDTTTPSGILGVFEKPEQGALIAASEVVLPITVIFDSLKDPGNAGTLIRTAAAIGCEKIITTKGSVNVWEPKVIRSAMGGHFCVPIYTGLSWSDVPNLLKNDTQILLAHPRPSKILTRTFSKSLTAEDLNIQDVELSESDNDTEDDEDAEELEKEALIREMKIEKQSQAFHKVPLTVFDYTDIQLTSRGRNRADELSVAVIVGGETEGLSALAKRFAYERYGHYVTIPMSKNVNSLNTGIAGSLILYELRRKLLVLRSEKIDVKS